MMRWDVRYSYQGAKLAKQVMTQKFNGASSTMKRTATFKLAKNGNLASMSVTDPYSTIATKYKNTYENGRLAKREVYQNDALAFAYAYAYAYKPIKASKAGASVVDAQQWSLLNENLNFALGIAATY